MKKYLFHVLMLLASSIVSAKQSAPTTDNLQPATGQTYAVVVGISDYQDEGIPDLRFADKDAIAFADFLRSPAGGSLDSDHLKMLLNEQATQAQFANALDWLWEVVRENDHAIIYFSGHGDVEKKSITQPGFLLCWDAPSSVYMAGGAFPLGMLQEVVSTISIQNKAKVIMVADACRSGKLSGSNVGGAQITGGNLAKQYANEIKILSCQPDEYSIEGEQWGGGRGAFSFHLLDGLYGMADGNSDGSVNLMEIARYLEKKIPAEVAPQSQTPMTIGNRGKKLTDVFPDILEKLKTGKNSQLELFTATEARGIEEEVLAAADSNIVDMYFAFKQAIVDKKFLSPAAASATADKSADFFYEKLSKEPQLERLHSSMRRNYAAALQDDAQQVMNRWLKSGLDESVTARKDEMELYGHFPQQIGRAIELLGEGHYLHDDLSNRKLFFESKLVCRTDAREGLRKVEKVIENDPDMVFAYVQMAHIYRHHIYQPDSVRYFYNKASEIIPSWTLPLVELQELEFNERNFDKAEELLERAEKTDSNSIYVWYAQAVLYHRTNRIEEAIKMYEKVVASSEVEGICFPCAWLGLGGLNHQIGNYDEALKQEEKAIELDPGFSRAYNFLGMTQNALGLNEAAEKSFLKTIELDSNSWPTYANLGSLYEQLGRWEESAAMTEKAIEIAPPIAGLYAQLGYAYIHIPGEQSKADAALQKALELQESWPDTYIYLAALAVVNQEVEKAWEYLEQGLEKDINNGHISPDEFQKIKEFEVLKNDPRWEALMKKYFPGTNND